MVCKDADKAEAHLLDLIFVRELVPADMSGVGDVCIHEAACAPEFLATPAAQCVHLHASGCTHTIKAPMLHDASAQSATIRAAHGLAHSCCGVRTDAEPGKAAPHNVIKSWQQLRATHGATSLCCPMDTAASKVKHAKASHPLPLFQLKSWSS